MLQSLTDLKIKIDFGQGTVKLEGSKSSTRRRRRSSSRSPDLEGSTKDSNSSSHGEKRRRHYRNSSWDKFKKVRPPTFNGEIKSGQEDKA